MSDPAATNGFVAKKFPTIRIDAASLAVWFEELQRHFILSFPRVCFGFNCTIYAMRHSVVGFQSISVGNNPSLSERVNDLNTASSNQTKAIRSQPG